jgi:hypothetical protein
MGLRRRGFVLGQIAIDRIPPVVQPLRRVVPWLALCALVTGCATSDGPYFFADAGKYQFHSCEQLAVASKQKHDRQRELKELIDKAEQAAGGQIVSVLAYRSDYVAVNEELQVIDSAVREKNCAASPPSKGAPRR